MNACVGLYINMAFMIVNMSHIIVEYHYYLALPYSENVGLGFEFVGTYSWQHFPPRSNENSGTPSYKVLFNEANHL